MRDVPYNNHFEAFQCFVTFTNREQVEQGLGRVFVRPIASIDHWAFDVGSDHLRHPRNGVTDHKNIRVHCLQVVGGVQQAFSLRGAARRCRNIDDVGTQSFSSNFEGDAGAGTRFKKQIDNGPASQGGYFFNFPGGYFFQRSRRVQNDFYIFICQILDAQYVPIRKCHIAQSWLLIMRTRSSPSVSCNITCTFIFLDVGIFLPTKSGRIGNSRCPRSIKTAN